MKIAIRGGHLIDPANALDAPLDLYLAEGRVAAVGKAPDGFHADRGIDARGRVVCPGLIDLRARLREPGEADRADIASETRAAAAGGVTTLCCPPDTDPVMDTPAVATLVQRRAQAAGSARVLPVGALTRGLEGRQLSEMGALAEAGCVALGDGGRPTADNRVQRRAFEYAATFGLLCMTQPQDPQLTAGGCAHDGTVATRLGLPGIPESAETLALARDLALAEETGVRLHFNGLSSARGVRLLGRGRYDNPRVTADVAIHQLHLDEHALEGFDPNCHVLPPLRTGADRDALRNALAQGHIAAICSDHQPHDRDAKTAPFPDTAPGISALETLLPLTLALVDLGLLTLAQGIERLTLGPARVLDLPYGRLDPGRSADICIFDPERRWTLRPTDLLSHGHNTPFIGRELRGRVTHTLLAGRLVYEESKP